VALSVPKGVNLQYFNDGTPGAPGSNSKKKHSAVSGSLTVRRPNPLPLDTLTVGVNPAQPQSLTIRSLLTETLAVPAGVILVPKTSANTTSSLSWPRHCVSVEFQLRSLAEFPVEWGNPSRGWIVRCRGSGFRASRNKISLDERSGQRKRKDTATALHPTPWVGV